MTTSRGRQAATPASPVVAPPWAWDEAERRRRATSVAAGASLRPVRWPGGARYAVALSFDADHDTPALRDGVGPVARSEAAYGPLEAMPRIERLLARHAAVATWFVPAVAAELHPDRWRPLTAAGHEVALHGWIHERPSALGPSVERDLVGRAADLLERIAGVRPVGYRAPSFDLSPATLGILVELGLAYDSSMMARDEPYPILLDGAPSGLVEVPVDWTRDDAAYLLMDRWGGIRPAPRPRDLLETWLDELAVAREEGGLFQLTMHPDLIGHRSRIGILGGLLDAIAAGGDAWIATHAAVAAWCMGHAG